MTSAKAKEAFDLRREKDSLRQRYGATSLGQCCLLARRLVEGGARFVLVDYGYDPEYGNLWDNHNAPVQNHPPIVEIVKRPWGELSFYAEDPWGNGLCFVDEKTLFTGK